MVSSPQSEKALSLKKNLPRDDDSIDSKIELREEGRKIKPVLLGLGVALLVIFGAFYLLFPLQFSNSKSALIAGAASLFQDSAVDTPVVTPSFLNFCSKAKGMEMNRTDIQCQLAVGNHQLVLQSIQNTKVENKKEFWQGAENTNLMFLYLLALVESHSDASLRNLLYEICPRGGSSLGCIGKRFAYDLEGKSIGKTPNFRITNKKARPFVNYGRGVKALRLKKYRRARAYFNKAYTMAPKHQFLVRHRILQGMVRVAYLTTNRKVLSTLKTKISREVPDFPGRLNVWYFYDILSKSKYDNLKKILARKKAIHSYFRESMDLELLVGHSLAKGYRHELASFLHHAHTGLEEVGTRDLVVEHLVRSYLSIGKFEEALRILERNNLKIKKSVRHHLRGIAIFATAKTQEHFLKAAASFRKASSEKRHWQSLYAMGKANIKVGDLNFSNYIRPMMSSRIEGRYKKLLRLMLLADAKAQEAKLGAARKILENASLQHQNFFPVWQARIDVLNKAGQSILAKQVAGVMRRNNLYRFKGVIYKFDPFGALSRWDGKQKIIDDIP